MPWAKHQFPGERCAVHYRPASAKWHIVSVDGMLSGILRTVVNKVDCGMVANIRNFKRWLWPNLAPYSSTRLSWKSLQVSTGCT